MSNIILVNKSHSIDLDYVPVDLEDCDTKTQGSFNYGSTIRREVLDKFIALRKDALKKKYEIYVYSGFRSSQDQSRTFNRFFDDNLLKLQEKFPFEKDEILRREAYILTTKRVALPGQSEHQTGLAMDITCFYNRNYDEDISNDEEVEWMRDNAHKYGFILRYPRGKEGITGYNFEPWHYRYVGEKYSHDITDRGFTLEEYYERVLKR